jgi:hypothetical protein
MSYAALPWVLLALFVIVPGCSSEAPTFVCGTPTNHVDCKHDELCVIKAAGTSTSYRCAENPCGANAVACSCAFWACEGLPCALAEGNTVHCACLAC